MRKGDKKQNMGNQIYSVKERYNYLKDMSTHICDYLEKENFGVSKKELDIFIQILHKELEFKFHF